ncbi:MAG: hypothetical protein WBD07_09510 [Vicinamibacterales bacterium]
MRTTIAYLLAGCAVLMAGTAMLAAPGQDRPGQLTQSRMFIENRGSDQAVPVSIENDSLRAPLRVQIAGAPPVTIGGSIVLPTRTVRQAWEYQTLRVAFGQDPSAMLEPLGLQGWEATGQLPSADGGALLLLKRPQ